jgi:hypothetical protein
MEAVHLDSEMTQIGPQLPLSDTGLEMSLG